MPSRERTTAYVPPLPVPVTLDLERFTLHKHDDGYVTIEPRMLDGVTMRLHLSPAAWMEIGWWLRALEETDA